MERAGNEDTDPDAERKGLGTPATRAAVIEKLVSSGFVERKGKQLIQSAGLDELNYLGNLLSMQSDGDRDKFTAAVTLGERAGSVKDLINLAQNLDCYWLYPTVQNEEDYGYYLIDELDELELPEEAKKYFMYEEYGRDAAINDGGRFTEQGYIYNNKNTFTEWYNGKESDIPREYKVMSFPQPERPDPSKAEMDAAAPGQKTAQTTEQPQEPRPVIPIVLTSEKPADKMKEIALYDLCDRPRFPGNGGAYGFIIGYVLICHIQRSCLF